MPRPSERSLLLLLASVQFTHIMDFMIMMPLGPQLMRDLGIGPGRFSALVATYTISSGIVGLGAAPFIDRFDRRRLLLFTYAGFVLATLACALSHGATTLLGARALSGMFGGISGSLVLAIVSDVVPPERRAAGIGIIMTAFSVAAALGVPFGLQLAQRLDWEAPFFALASIGACMWFFLWRLLPSMRSHMQGQTNRWQAFLDLLLDANAGRALLFMAFLVFGHFAIIPLLSPFLVSNVGLQEKHLFLVYLTGGVVTVFTAPVVGRLADAFGRFRVYCGLVAVACVVTLAISNASIQPLWLVLLLSSLFFIFASGRFVPGQAIMTLAVPSSRRGAFMSLTSCARDLASGLSSSVGGWIVVKEASGQMRNFHWLGWMAVASALVSVWIASKIRMNDAPTAVKPPDDTGRLPAAGMPDPVRHEQSIHS